MARLFFPHLSPAKKLTNDLAFVNPNCRQIPYNSVMRAVTLNFPLLTFNTLTFDSPRLPAALRQQDTPERQEHASLPPEKNSSTAATTAATGLVQSSKSRGGHAHV
jgi:hypothetical protein